MKDNFPSLSVSLYLILLSNWYILSLSLSLGRETAVSLRIGKKPLSNLDPSHDLCEDLQYPRDKEYDHSQVTKNNEKAFSLRYRHFSGIYAKLF